VKSIAFHSKKELFKDGLGCLVKVFGEVLVENVCEEVVVILELVLEREYVYSLGVLLVVYDTVGVVKRAKEAVELGRSEALEVIVHINEQILVYRCVKLLALVELEYLIVGFPKLDVRLTVDKTLSVVEVTVIVCVSVNTGSAVTVDSLIKILFKLSAVSLDVIALLHNEEVAVHKVGKVCESVAAGLVVSEVGSGVNKGLKSAVPIVECGDHRCLTDHGSTDEGCAVLVSVEKVGIDDLEEIVILSPLGNNVGVVGCSALSEVARVTDLYSRAYDSVAVGVRSSRVQLSGMSFKGL
jgi:hypothetical protein